MKQDICTHETRFDKFLVDLPPDSDSEFNRKNILQIQNVDPYRA
jgi:hypothetical protein